MNKKLIKALQEIKAECEKHKDDECVKCPLKIECSLAPYEWRLEE